MRLLLLLLLLLRHDDDDECNEVLFGDHLKDIALNPELLYRQVTANGWVVLLNPLARAAQPRPAICRVPMDGC